MTDLNQQQILFGSGTPDGLMVELAVTPSWTTLHVATGGKTGVVDLVTLTVTNRTAGALDLTVGFGGQANKDSIVLTVQGKTGQILVLDREPLSQGQTVYAKTSGAGLNARVTVGRLSG